MLIREYLRPVQPLWTGWDNRSVDPEAGGGALSNRINARYDHAMYSKIIDDYYGQSGFHNYGYWTSSTMDQRQASENLVDMLVRFFGAPHGNVLDVACGLGASTERLLRHFPAEQVTGINISDRQLATCRRRVPGCRFINMDATKLAFPDGSFNNILCVEAAFHFDTREAFLQEAFRVLKEGGSLALSDILVRTRGMARLMKSMLPEANFVETLEDYQAQYERIGFEKIRITEARAECWEGFRDNCLKYVREKIGAGRAGMYAFLRVAAALRRNDWLFKNYLLVSARKPSRGERPRR